METDTIRKKYAELDLCSIREEFQKYMYNKIQFELENCFLIKNKDNTIKRIKNHKDFNPNEGDNILFRIRKSLKSNVCEAIKPINEHKIYKSEFSDNHLDDKIWYPVKSEKYHDEGNNQNYNLNENDIIKIEQKNYSVFKKHCPSEEKKIINY